jgi:hypothetical protein
MKKIMKQLFIRSIAFVTIITMGCIAVSAKILVPFYKTSSNSWEGKFYSAPISEAGAPDNWYEENFDDSSWNTISSPLYLSNGKWQANYYSYWVRCYFTIEELNSSNSFTFYAQHDDGCVAYLNGQEIYNNGNVSDYSSINLSSEAISTLKKGTNVLCVKVSDTGGGDAFMDFGLYENELQNIVTRADIPVTITNDENHPWSVDGTTATIKGNDQSNYYAASWLTISYGSDKRTELSFEWARYDYGYHDALQVYIDGVYKGNTTNSSYTSKRFYLDVGEHVIAFRDSVGGYNYSRNWSGIRNVKIKNITSLENSVLTENSQPLLFENNGTWPWTIEDGYIQNSNYGTAYSSSRFSTTFTIERTSKLSYEVAIPLYDYYYDYTYNSNGVRTSCHDLYVNINGRQWEYWQAKRDWTTDKIILEPGTYTVEFLDTIRNTTNNYFARLRNIELTSNWTEVEVATAGTLGVEVLYKVDVLNDVEMLKVKGPLNATDWATIKQMSNLTAIDLSEAIFEALPNNAFDGMTWIGSVILPEGMKTIGSYAFRGTRIINIQIPSTVTYIGFAAFEGVWQLTNVSFAENSKLQEIGKYAFKTCSKLSTINLPNSLEIINYAAFDQCSSLKEVYMPNSVTFVGAYAYQGCTSLKSMHFSDALTEIPEWVCNDCYALTDIHLPVNLIRINYEAFRDNTSLRHIDIPKSVNTIVRLAFYNCGLDSIILPTRLQYLGTEAFSYCNNLKYIEFPSYIERGSYSYCYSYGSDGDRKYWDNNNSGYRSNFTYCPSIETIVMRSAAPPVNDADAFANSRAKSAITLKVPSFAVVNYKLDSYWYQFGSIVEGDDVDYWRIASSLSLTNNRRMQGKPDIDLYYGGQFTVGGNAPMEAGLFNVFVSESNPACLLNTCEAMTADSINSYFSVSSETWYFITPLHDVDLTKVTVSNGASYVFRYYDGSSRATNGTGNSWRNVDNGKLTAGQGYIFRCNANAVVTFPAEASVHAQVFNTDDVTIALNAFEAAASANKSWNFVGNPYPCYFDIYYMDFTAPITVWTGSTYKAYSIVDDNLVLRPMQSFFVQKPDAVDNIIFHKEGRQLTTSINHEAAAARAFSAPARAANTISRRFFNLQLISDEMEDETRLVINDNASLGYEIERDASKFMSFESNVPQIFTMDGDGNGYAINERPMDDGTVKLAYYAGQSGFYTLSATRADGDIYLHDALLNKTVNLMEQDYTFHSDTTEGTNNTRFTLSLSGGDTTGIKSVKETESGNGDCYDLQGRKVQPSVKKGIYIQNGRKVVK